MPTGLDSLCSPNFRIRFYFDTVTCDHAALGHLIGQVGSDRLLLGSDYCFSMSEQDPVGFVRGIPGLDTPAQEAILGGNARRLFGPSAG